MNLRNVRIPVIHEKQLVREEQEGCISIFYGICSIEDLPEAMRIMKEQEFDKEKYKVEFPFDFKQGTSFGSRKWSTDFFCDGEYMQINNYENVEATKETALVSTKTITGYERAFWLLLVPKNKIESTSEFSGYISRKDRVAMESINFQSK